MNCDSFINFNESMFFRHSQVKISLGTNSHSVFLKNNATILETDSSIGNLYRVPKNIIFHFEEIYFMYVNNFFGCVERH